MTEQLDLFAWADGRPSNIIDAMPALIRRAAIETIYQIPKRKGQGQVLLLARRAA